MGRHRRGGQTWPLPGDELLPDADLTATRAITVDAAAADVWPWIAQLGQGRGGFYSYDFLENLVGCDIHSADRIVPEWQNIEAGNQVKLHPEVAPDRGRSWTGTRPRSCAAGSRWAEPAAPYDFTWAFVLRDRAVEQRRLAGPRALQRTRCRWAACSWSRSS